MGHMQLARCGLQVGRCGSITIITVVIIIIEHRSHIVIRMTVTIIMRTLGRRRISSIAMASIARVLACGGK